METWVSGGNFSRRSRSNARVPLFPTDASDTKVSPCIPITHTRPDAHSKTIDRTGNFGRSDGDRKYFNTFRGQIFAGIPSEALLLLVEKGRNLRNTLWCRWWYGHALIPQGENALRARGESGPTLVVCVTRNRMDVFYLPWMDGTEWDG